MKNLDIDEIDVNPKDWIFTSAINSNTTYKLVNSVKPIEYFDYKTRFEVRNGKKQYFA